MNGAFTLFKQLVVMLIFLVSGRLLFQAKLISEDGSRALANILLYLALPAAIVRSYSILPNNPGNERIVLIALAGALVVTIPGMIVAGIIFRKKPLDNFAASYCNAGFVGVPLVSALLGPAMVAYMTGIIALQNVLQWTYGQYLFSGDKKTMKPVQIIQSPLVIALVLGLLIFFLRIPIPGLIEGGLSSLGDMTNPLAMILMGVYLGKESFRDLFADGHAYFTVAIRLIIIPLVTLPLIMLMPGSTAMKTVLFISCATPAPTNVAVYAQRQNLDYGYAVKIVCLAIVFCIVTLPLLIALFNLVV